ncbi:MAG: class I SAM-dependent methyltransferase [Pseudomonadota bacterium]
MFIAALVMKKVRGSGLYRQPVTRSILRTVGVFPLRNHYYDPLFLTGHLDPEYRRKRTVPGLDLNTDRQLALLAEFVRYRNELLAIPMDRSAGHRHGEFFYNNGAFGPGDAEMLYCMIRHFKPARIMEIGSGQSTLMAQNAIRENKRENPLYACRHVCVEPYEHPWLKDIGVELLRTPVEKLDVAAFDELGENDILFIDSSHIIRPQGDVLFEYIELLPRLAPGTLVHIHDIFTPRDYPNEWVIDKIRFWNEQYLLEAFLSCNNQFEVLSALNHLATEHQAAFQACCPVYGEVSHLVEPGSFWIRRVG